MRGIIILAIICAVLLLGGNGCMQNKPAENNSMQNNKLNINDVAITYMEQKYGENFEYVSPWGNSMSGTHELLVRCNNFQNQEILVRIENYKEASKTFKDNYMAVKYRDETIDFLHNCASQVFGESTVFYDVAKVGSELPANATFEEYLSDPFGFISAYIEIKSSDFSSKEQAQEVAKAIATACKADYLSLIIIVVDNDLYGTFDNEAIKEQVVQREFVSCMRLTREDGIIQTEWLGEE